MILPFPPRFIFLCFLIAAVVLEVAGDIFFKKWVLESKNILFILGLVVYFVGTVFWALSLRYEMLSRAISVFTVLNLIIISLIGVLYFNENLSAMQKIGIGLGILSVILIEM